MEYGNAYLESRAGSNCRLGVCVGQHDIFEKWADALNILLCGSMVLQLGGISKVSINE